MTKIPVVLLTRRAELADITAWVEEGSGLSNPSQSQLRAQLANHSYGQYEPKTVDGNMNQSQLSAIQSQFRKILANHSYVQYKPITIAILANPCQKQILANHSLLHVISLKYNPDQSQSVAILVNHS